MAFAHHIHDWRWLHATGRVWHRHVVAAWAITIASLGLVAALALLTGSTDRGISAGHRVRTSSPFVVDGDAHPITVPKQTGIELRQTGTARAKLEVARRAWEVACALPMDRNAEYRLLLRRAAELLADPGVIDIMEPDDRILKARVAVELAPAIDVIEPPPYPPV